MTINPETLKALREQRRLSQQDLADRTNVSKRQISRIETGQTHSDKVRRHTIESLAKALETTVEELSQPLEDKEAAEALLGEAGYRTVKMVLDPETRLNFELAERHYGVSMRDLVHAAPWMFTLLAESSLAERRRRLEEASAAFENAMDRLPRHLSHGAPARIDFDETHKVESSSISERDIFGARVLERAEVDSRFVPDPFLEFVRAMAQACGSEAISDEYSNFYFGDVVLPGWPHWPIFQPWLVKLTDRKWLAYCAIERGFAGISDIPEELLADDRGSDRAAWLVSKVPPELREEIEKIFAEEGEP